MAQPEVSETKQYAKPSEKSTWAIEPKEAAVKSDNDRLYYEALAGSQHLVAGGQMRCPKCQTVQPRSDRCRGCGVYWHKLFSKEESQAAPRGRTAVVVEEGRAPSKAPVIVIVGVALAAIAGGIAITMQ